MNATDTRLTLNTSELQLGDVVHTHGMRVELDRTIRTVDRGDDLAVYVTAGLVLNADEVIAAGQVPAGYLDTDEGGRRRWTIQGNELATWAVTREEGDRWADEWDAGVCAVHDALGCTVCGVAL